MDLPLNSLADAKDPWNKAILYLTFSDIVGKGGSSVILPLFLKLSKVLSILTKEKPMSSMIKDVDVFRTETLGISKVEENTSEGLLGSDWS